MASFADFGREMRTISFRPGTRGGEIVAAELATFARAELARVIQSGEGSPRYGLFVNGREAVTELDVEVPGSIVYVFSWWNEVITAALTELIKRSPRKSGRYASSFIVMANGTLVMPGGEIPDGAEIVIANAQPYTRKVEVGAMKMSVPPRHFEGARRVMVRRFGGDGGFGFRVEFLHLASGIHPLVPYRLKGEYARRRNSWLDLVATGRARHGMKSFPRRRDREPGQQITYPSLVIRLLN
jgi:hypothetical protein